MEDRGYLHGVPFLLGKKFIPLQIQDSEYLPIDLGPLPSGLAAQYDFDLERSTILTTNSYYQEKERRLLEAEERRKAAAERKRLEEEAEIKAREKELKLAYEEMRRKNAEETSPVHTQPQANGHGHQNHISSPVSSLETQSEEEGQGQITGTTPAQGSVSSDSPQPQQQFRNQAAPTALVSSNCFQESQQFRNSSISPQQQQYRNPAAPIPISSSSSAPHISPVPASYITAPSSVPTYINRPRINLSDFESDTASRSPFDLVALSSLDDRKELASILGNMSLNNTNQAQVIQQSSCTQNHQQNPLPQNQNQHQQQHHQPAIQSYFRRDYDYQHQHQQNPYFHHSQSGSQPQGYPTIIQDHRNSLYSMNLNSTANPALGGIPNPQPQLQSQLGMSIPMPMPMPSPYIFGGSVGVPGSGGAITNNSTTGAVVGTSGHAHSHSQCQTIGTSTTSVWPRFP